MLRVRLAVAVMTVAGMGIAAVSAQAFQRTTYLGTPGAFVKTYNPSLEAGICDATSEPPACSDNGTGNLNQMFLNGVTVYSTTAYSGRQNVIGTAFLFYQTSSGSWTQAASKGLGACSNIPGGGTYGCRFGSPSPDKLPSGQNCTFSTAYCHPIFVNMVRNRNWTVKLLITWRNASAGNNIAQAGYYTYSTNDLGCAGFASLNRRCNGPFSAARSNLGTPASTVSFVGMP